MTDITPIYVGADPDKLFREAQYLDGEEVDLLDAEGIRFDEATSPMRMAIAIGWLRLRRDHPTLSYKDARKSIRINLAEMAGPEDPAPADPPVSGADG